MRCGSKNECQNDIMCVKESELHAQNMINSPSSISSINRGDTYDPLTSTGNFTLLVNKIFIRAPKIMGKVAMGLKWTCSPSCTNGVFHALRGGGYLGKSNHLRPM